jgi:hypothetical protein
MFIITCFLVLRFMIHLPVYLVMHCLFLCVAIIEYQEIITESVLSQHAE